VPERLDLSRPRSLGELLDTTFALQRRWFSVFFSVTAIVYVPFVLLVNGIWQHQLRSGVHGRGSTAAQAVAELFAPIVVPALVTALSVRIVQGLAEGTEPSIGRAFRMLPPVAFPAIVATTLYLVGMVVGFVLLIVPGLIVLVRWYFAPQAAVVDGARGFAAVEASRRLVRGRGWELFWRLLTMGLIVGILIAVPESIVGSAVHQGWIYVAVVAVLGTIGASLNAVYGTLLFFTFRTSGAGDAPVLGPST
jgi:hypothetical protein